MATVRGARVVDLRCGCGAFGRSAVEQGAADVLGIGLSEPMLARERALHYVVDLSRLVTVMHDAMRPGGHFIFAIEHPTFTAPTKPRSVPDAGDRVIEPLRPRACGSPLAGARRAQASPDHRPIDELADRRRLRHPPGDRVEPDGCPDLR